MSEPTEFDPQALSLSDSGGQRRRSRRRTMGRRAEPHGVEPLRGNDDSLPPRAFGQDLAQPEAFQPGRLSSDGAQLVQNTGGNWSAMMNPLLGTPAVGVPLSGGSVPGLPPAGAQRPAWPGTSTSPAGTPRAGLPLSAGDAGVPTYPPARPRARRPNRALGGTPAGGLPDPSQLPPPSLPRGIPSSGFGPLGSSAPSPARSRETEAWLDEDDDPGLRRTADDDVPLDHEPRRRRAAAHMRDPRRRDRNGSYSDHDEENDRPVRGTDRPRSPGRPGKKTKTPSNAAVGAITEVLVVVSMALVLALVIKTFLVQAFFIPSESMENSLLVGDRVLVNKLVPGVIDLHRGDVVVFKDPGGWLTPEATKDEGPVRNAIRSSLTFVGLLPQDSGEHLIKRVIGMPGDTVACCDVKGRITVNGAPIDEPYLFPGNAPSTLNFSVTVPANRLWVMGDHRAVSEDSRYHPTLQRGTISIDDVVGKAFVIVWPMSRAGSVASAGSAFDKVPDPKSPS